MENDPTSTPPLATPAAPVEPAPDGPGARRGITLPRTFAALKHRNYRLFFFGQLISLVGTWMQNVAQAWLVYQLTDSPFYLGVVMFASGVPVLALSLWAGVVVDRVPKQRLLIATQTFMMLLAFVLAADVFLGTVVWWHVAIMAFLLGTANSFDAPARQAFVVEMVGRADLMNAIALNSAIFNSARIVGPAVAGVALAAVGTAWCFILNGVSFLAVIAGLTMMNVKPYVGATSKESPVAQMREGVRYIWHHATIRVLIAIIAVSNVFAFGYSTLLPAFARDVLHAGEVGYGMLSASIGIGALAGALLIASLGEYQHKGRLLTAGNLLFPAMVLGVAFSTALPLTMGLLVFTGLGFMVQNATVNTLIQTSVPDNLRGRVMSVYMMVFQGFFPVGALLIGALAERFSVPIGAGIGGGVALAYSLYLLWRAPFVRQLA